jgi:hypothetical protein
MFAECLIARFWHDAEMDRDGVKAGLQYVLPKQFVGESKYLLCVELY